MDVFMEGLRARIEGLQMEVARLEELWDVVRPRYVVSKPTTKIQPDILGRARQEQGKVPVVSRSMLKALSERPRLQYMERPSLAHAVEGKALVKGGDGDPVGRCADIQRLVLSPRMALQPTTLETVRILDTFIQGKVRLIIQRK